MVRTYSYPDPHGSKELEQWLLRKGMVLKKEKMQNERYKNANDWKGRRGNGREWRYYDKGSD
jgi:hypothetical protein